MTNTLPVRIDPVFSALEPAAVWAHFATLCRIPRQSKAEAGLRDEIRRWALARGLSATVDAAGNLLLCKVASSGIGLQRQGDNIVLVMPSDVTFSKGSAMLDAQFTPVLSKVAESLNLYPKTTIDIVGHASTEGEAQANLDLSYRRAESVRVYLQGAGVLPQRMATGGLGESQPIVVPDDTEAKRAQNRRVVITLRPVTQ